MTIVSQPILFLFKNRDCGKSLSNYLFFLTILSIKFIIYIEKEGTKENEQCL